MLFRIKQIAEMKPKVSYYDVVLNCKDLISTSAIAKDYSKSAIWMNRYLNKRAYSLNKVGSGFYIRSMEKGYTSTKTHSYLGSNGQQHTKVHTYWTQRQTLHLRIDEGGRYFASDRNGGCVMGINKFNHEGYHDPTPHEALTNIMRKEKAEKNLPLSRLYISVLPTPAMKETLKRLVAFADLPWKATVFRLLPTLCFRSL